MKIGYPCINTEIGCTANSTFRLANLSNEKLTEKINNNLYCLENILSYNHEKGLLFFRIGSQLIPFAGYKKNKYNWEKVFGKRIQEVGCQIKKLKMRVSMHPDQFVLINALKKEIIINSILELGWHSKLLDVMGLDFSAKVQIHVGGGYGDKKSSMERFIENYKKLPLFIKKRLVIENDDRIYSLKDCLYINSKTGIPVLFDVFHHKCLNNGESIIDSVSLSGRTWKKEDGLPIIDYSSQNINGRKGKHAEKIDIEDFSSFIYETKEIDFDIMLEIKDKQKSAIKALREINKIRNILKYE
jgi:UV DNA damage endonuclease